MLRLGWLVFAFFKCYFRNEQEITLLDEKHKEEVALYQLKLANSSRTIQELEEKLSSYQSKRADMAEKLHSVMETQWKKALEILTSPSSVVCEDDDLNDRLNRFKLRNSDKNRMDGVESVRNIAENEVFQTPIKQKLPQDVLHNYIELLLRKSPKDLESLNEILASCKKPKEAASKSAPSTGSKMPKPWK
jgi:predicted  nucleic acid-binding Zn-ribbon protein